MKKARFECPQTVELVTNEHFQKRTVMFVGTRNWKEVASWLRVWNFASIGFFQTERLI
jgi:hypothetical protein